MEWITAMQQAITYGIMMNVPFVYTSNGDSFFEHDFTTGLERELPLSEFPTADELMARWRGVNAEKITEVGIMKMASSTPEDYYNNTAVTSEAGTTAMANDMGFVIPFKNAVESFG